MPQELTFHMVEERILSLDEIDEIQYQPSSIQSEINQSLYESIKQVGLQSPLVVAQVPNEKRFVPIAGGNSRLQVLSRLYDETGDESFAKVQCVVSEWPGNARARLAHVITNQVRLRYSFASRALAIVHIVNSERASKESNSIPQREAVQLLTSNGYPISQTTYSYMEYLVHQLQPNIRPQLLNALSMTDVRELRELETRASEHLSNQFQLSSDFSQLFARTIEDSATESVDVDGLIEHVRLKASFMCEERSTDPRLGFKDPSFSKESVTNTSAKFLFKSEDSNKIEEQTVSQEATRSQPYTSSISSQSTCNKVLASQITESKKREDSTQSTIEELRETARRLALHLCDSFNLNKCIRIESQQCGYRIVSKPSCETSTIQYRLWNYLDVFAGSDKRPLDVSLWADLNDKDWRALIELWEVVRAIRKNGRSGSSELHDEVPKSL